MVSLLAMTARTGDTTAYQPPWGAIEWAWPSREVVQITDLRQQEETAALRQIEASAAVDRRRRRLPRTGFQKPARHFRAAMLGGCFPLGKVLARNDSNDG